MDYIGNLTVVLMEYRIWDFREHASALIHKSGILFIVYATQELKDHVISKIFLINKVTWYKSHFNIIVTGHVLWENKIRDESEERVQILILILE